MIGNPLIQTTQQSTKVFYVADGRQTPGSNISKFHHPVRKLARTVMVPALAGQSLLRGENFAEDRYISVYDYNEVNLYDSQIAHIKVSEEAVLKGWFFPRLRCGEFH